MTNEHAVWRGTRLVVRASAILLLLAMLVPLAVVVMLSFSDQSYLSFPPNAYSLRWYYSFFSNGDYRDAIGNSLIVGVTSAFLATVAGTLVAIAVVRGFIPGRNAVSVLMMAPAILPQIILAIGLYPISVTLALNGTFWAIILAHATVSIPFPFIAVCGALQGYSSRLEYAAMSLGATPRKTFQFVTLPLIRASVFAGFVFALAFSIDELVLAIFLTSPSTRTLSRLLWEQLNFEVTPEIAAAATVLLTFTILLIMTANLVTRLSQGKPKGQK
jgi:ABC-type spermidine/putrescine transport system permease subunit II